MREAVQLIQKSTLGKGLWLTFWKLKRQRRFAVEIRLPVQMSYEIGSVYLFDRTASDEKACFVPLKSIDPDLEKLLLLPMSRQPQLPQPVDLQPTAEAQSTSRSGHVRMLEAF